MTNIDMLATIAGICTTISFLPQVAKVWTTRHTEDLSLPMYIIFSVGLMMWIFYGALIRSTPVILANAVTLILALFILIMKVKYK